ncbi:MAG: hypothetical protein K9K86_10555, partial [Pseudomonadales bacterium]|nr:hypothetical protein [Pseudomonadales bacterium]
VILIVAEHRFNIRARSHYQEATQPGCRVLHFVTDICSHSFREHPFIKGLSRQYIIPLQVDGIFYHFFANG